MGPEGTTACPAPLGPGAGGPCGPAAPGSRVSGSDGSTTGHGSGSHSRPFPHDRLRRRPHRHWAHHHPHRLGQCSLGRGCLWHHGRHLPLQRGRTIIVTTTAVGSAAPSARASLGSGLCCCFGLPSSLVLARPVFCASCDPCLCPSSPSLWILFLWGDFAFSFRRAFWRAFRRTLRGLGPLPFVAPFFAFPSRGLVVTLLVGHLVGHEHPVPRG